MVTQRGAIQQPALPPPIPAIPAMAPYNVLTYKLDAARVAPGKKEEIPGDTITAYTDGTLVGCFIRMDSPANDPIPLNEFNPYYYPAKFKKFWLTTTAQAGKYLRLHIGREAGAEAAVQITATAPKRVFYEILSDKDTNFTSALTTGNKEDENITGLLGDKVNISGITIEADQALDFWIMFWKKDTFDDPNLDLDSFIGAIELDLSTYGQQVGGAGQYYMSLEDVLLDYEDGDGTKELHVSLYNADAIAKNAGATGEVKVVFRYELMGQ